VKDEWKYFSKGKGIERQAEAICLSSDPLGSAE